ncbi:glycosyltransferase family 2 protein [Pseudomonas brassicacearum]|uniref:glycosyltransferase family 2 protein n=1 Tax=Pseudomonas brassicacearum TaxID=930166 RepID=UPI001622007C|nr:glycosyltransferase family 2 protein [Pseudomonas brassicacearum]
MNSLISPVCAVIITYHPDLNNLQALLNSLASQVAQVVIVDNGSSASLELFADSQTNIQNLSVLSLGDNYGIGYAQNVGIEHAQKTGLKYVALFDQDSCPETEMIPRLCSAFEALQRQDIKVAAVAPCYKDTQGGVLSTFVRVGLFGFKRTAPSNVPVEADFLISSGSLIPLSVIADLGGVDASLFIDHVDTEWCFRAKAHGYKLYGVPSAIMLHSLGDRRIRFWFLRWRTVPYHSPFRYYYMFRNSVLLQRRSYMPFCWKMADLGRCIRAAIFFGLFSTTRLACLRMMIRGAIDGMAGVTGKMK